MKNFFRDLGKLCSKLLLTAVFLYLCVFYPIGAMVMMFVLIGYVLYREIARKKEKEKDSEKENI